MPFRIALYAALAFFTILPVSKSIAATGFFTDDSAAWTTTDTNTTTSATTSSMTMDSTSLDAAASSTSQSTSTQSYQSTRHGYDELDRLKWTQYEDGTVVSYEYDKVGNRTVKSTYMSALTPYTISVYPSSYGTVTPSGTINLIQGSSQGFLFKANPGACVVDVQVDDASAGVLPSYTFNNIAANHLLSVNFEPTYSCAPGYTFNPSSGFCEAAIQCPAGSTYNPDFDQCVQNNGDVCPSGYTYLSWWVEGYDDPFEICKATPICSEGVYNNSSKKCESSSTQTATCTSVTNNISFTGVLYYLPNFYIAPPAMLSGVDTDGEGASHIYGQGITFSNEISGYCYAVEFIVGTNTITIKCDNVYYGTLTVSGATLTKTGNTNFQIYDSYVQGNANKLDFYDGTGYLKGSITFTPITTYTCPLTGGSICSGSPPACSKTTIIQIAPYCNFNGVFDQYTNLCKLQPTYACQPGLSPSYGYCAAMGSCLSGGSLNTSLNLCQSTRTVNCTADNPTLTPGVSSDAPPCTNYPARRAGATTVNYLSLHSAYNAAANGDTIQGNMYDHFESLRLDRNVSVTLDGGYSCDYTSKSGNLTIKGDVTIANGTLIVNGNVILTGL
jgi:phage baseplate assembly protein gpV